MNMPLCPRFQEVQDSIEGNASMHRVVDDAKYIRESRFILAMRLSPRFICRSQALAINELLAGGEAWRFFADKLHEIKTIVDTMPRTYQTNGQGDEAIAYLHYFAKGCDWYITEIDIEQDLNQCFGYADLGQGPELGYISLPELMENGVELDLHFTPTAWKYLAC